MAGLRRVGLRLGGLKGREQGIEARLELATLLRHWERFLPGSTRAEVQMNFIEGGTETGGTLEGSEPAHRVVALFDGRWSCSTRLLRYRLVRCSTLRPNVRRMARG